MSRSPQLTHPDTIQVVVLVLHDDQDNVLLTQRQAGVHLAHYWEFPGGKVESGESLRDALLRESLEELTFTPEGAEHILSIEHNYPEKHVTLEVFQLKNNSQPTVQAAEGQNMRWVSAKQLHQYQLPPANQAIVDFLQKP